MNHKGTQERSERKTAGKDKVENQIKRLGLSRNVLLPASFPALSSDLIEMTTLSKGITLQAPSAECNKNMYNNREMSFYIQHFFFNETLLKLIVMTI